MHAGNVAKSDRLRMTLEVIRHAGPNGCTTHDIQLWTGSMAPATDVSELRQNGYLISCKCEGVNDNGRRVYRYIYMGRNKE